VNPTAAAVRAAAAVTRRVHVTVGAHPGPPSVPWVALSEPERLAALVDRTAAWCGGAPTSTARTAAASLMIGDVASALAGPMAGALVGQRRALLPDRDTLSLRFGPHGVDGLAMAAPGLGVLPVDPLAGLDGTFVLSDLDRVRAAVAEGYAELMRPVVDTLCAIDRRGRRAVWGDVAEAFAGAVFLAVRAVTRPHDAPEEVSRLLAVAPPGLAQPVRWVDVPRPDGSPRDTVPWKRRTVCCLAYQTPRFTGEYCATCPLLPAEETVRRIGAWAYGGGVGA
jgi:hypothetical protein